MMLLIVLNCFLQINTLISSAGPSSVRLSSPVVASHIFTKPSKAPVAKYFPSKLNLANSTVSFYLGVSIIGLSLLLMSHTLAISSPPPEMNKSTFVGWKLMQLTKSVCLRNVFKDKSIVFSRSTILLVF